jgi:hypothetical protein
MLIERAAENSYQGVAGSVSHALFVCHCCLRRLTAALERAGVPGGAINQDVVSADKAYFRDTSKVRYILY